ncbi:hypothetical protein [Mangrovimonas cancribranchiae]|uniref:Uncharacterized protein n=1 Tax=Mangrovimonas cancribranchiae TaxID=3080055 RepID=A0AAU6NWN3_9FLAO
MMNYQKNRNQELEPALGGFFSWLGRAVRNVANAVLEVSHNPTFIINIIKDAVDGGSFTVGYGCRLDPGFAETDVVCSYSNRVGEIPLTSSDEMTLDNWVNYKFTPFFKRYFEDLKNLNESNATMAQFIEHYNNTQEFIAVLKWHISNMHYAIGSLSTNAFDARKQFLSSQIEVIKSDLNKYMTDAGVDTAATEKTADISTAKYAVLDLDLPNSIEVTYLSKQQTVETISQELPTTATTAATATKKPVKLKSLALWTIIGIGLFTLATKQTTTNSKPKTHA